MDSITQLQNYVTTITQLMTRCVTDAHTATEGVSEEQVKAVLKEEKRQELARQQQIQQQQQQQQQTADGSGTAASALPSSSSSISADHPPSASSSTLYTGLSLSAESVLTDRAHLIFRRVLEADALIQSLPRGMGDSFLEEQRQLSEMAFLQERSEQLGKEIQQAREEAALWQARVRHVLQSAAACQLRAQVQQHDTRDSELRKKEQQQKQEDESESEQTDAQQSNDNMQ